MAVATCTATKDAQRKRRNLSSLTGRSVVLENAQDKALVTANRWGEGMRRERGVGEKGRRERVGVKMRRGLGIDARSCRSARRP